MGKTKKKIWSKDFFILFCITIVTSLGMLMLNPNMAEYAATLGAVGGMVGTVSSAYSLAALAARPFSGRAADRLDNKSLLILSLAGISACMFLFSLAHSMAAMLTIRFIQGLFFGLNSTLAMTMASRTLPEERMGAGMGVFSLGMVASMTIAPSIGIYICDKFGFSWLFYISAFIGVLATVLAMFLKKQPKPEQKKDAEKLPFWMTFFAPEAISPSSIAMLNSCAFGSINTFLLLHAKQQGIADIGLYFTVNAISLIVFRPIISKFMDKLPIKYIIYPCSCFLLLSVFFISIGRSLPMFLLAAVMFGIGNGGSQPALQTLCLKSVGNERRGAASGTYYIGLDIGNSVGPVVAGMLAPAFGYGGAFRWMMISIVMGMGVMFITDRLQKAKAQRA